MRVLWFRDYRRSTLMLWLLWFGVVFSYYGMVMWLPSVVTARFGMKQGFGYVLIMTLAQLPGYFSVAWLIERVGRKAVLTIYLLGTRGGAFFFGLAMSDVHVLVADGLLSFFNRGAWGALHLHVRGEDSTQLQPGRVGSAVCIYAGAVRCRVRATGTGIATAAGRLGGILGPLAAGYRLGHGASIKTVFAVFSVALLIAAFSEILLGTETRGKALDRS